MQISEQDARNLAIKLIGPVEELLDKHSIKVPIKDRTGDDTEASLFGETHALLEDNLVQLIKEHILILGEGPEKISDLKVCTFNNSHEERILPPKICLPEELPSLMQECLDKSQWSSMKEYEKNVDFEITTSHLSNHLSPALLTHITQNAALEYPVRGMLDVSTAHFPASDFKILMDPKSGIIYPYDEGWIVYVFNEDIDENVDPDDVSASFKKAADKARNLGCSFMMIDHDAAYHDDLDEYNHDNDVDPIKVTSKILHVNTDHLTPNDIDILNAPFQSTVFNNDFGWILHIDDNIPEEISDSFALIITKALDLKCNFILFSKESPIHEDLDIHEDCLEEV